MLELLVMTILVGVVALAARAVLVRNRSAIARMPSSAVCECGAVLSERAAHAAGWRCASYGLGGAPCWRCRDGLALVAEAEAPSFCV